MIVRCSTCGATAPIGEDSAQDIRDGVLRVGTGCGHRDADQIVEGGIWTPAAEAVAA